MFDLGIRDNKNHFLAFSHNNYFIIYGYATVYDIADIHKDVILKGAFNINNDSKLQLLWQHNKSKIIGSIISAENDHYGLRISAIINNNMHLARSIIFGIKQKKITGLSVGFYLKEAFYNGLGYRFISKASLAEISLVYSPANPYALITSYKDNIL